MDAPWKTELRDQYLPKASTSMDTTPHITLNGWRTLNKCTKLPWTAISLMTIATALICIFIVFIVNGPNQRTTVTPPTVVNGTISTSSRGLITIQCSTDVTERECDRRVRERALSTDFQQAMTETHLFTTLGVFWLAATIFWVIKAIRVRKRNRYLENLPRPTILVWSDLNNTQQAGAPAGNAAGQQQGQINSLGVNEIAVMAQKIPVHSSMELSIELNKLLRATEPYGACGDRNWMASTRMDRIEYKGTHFPTSIRLSYHQLETQVTAFDSSLRMQKDQTVREYVTMLKSIFPPQELNHTALDRFVDLYERARFGHSTVTEDDWFHSMSCLYSLSQAFENLRMNRAAAAAAAAAASKTTPSLAGSVLPFFPANLTGSGTPLPGITTSSSIVDIAEENTPAGETTPAALLSPQAKPVKSVTMPSPKPSPTKPLVLPSAKLTTPPKKVHSTEKSATRPSSPFSGSLQGSDSFLTSSVDVNLFKLKELKPKIKRTGSM